MKQRAKGTKIISVYGVSVYAHRKNEIGKKKQKRKREREIKVTKTTKLMKQSGSLDDSECRHDASRRLDANRLGW